jgi:hypothetical protein
METTMNIDLNTLEIINVIHTERDETMTPAERAYANIKKAVSKYQKANPDKCREKNKKAMENLKTNKPEEYALFLERKREYYIRVMKPKIQEKQRIKKEIKKKVRLAMEQDEIRSLDGINDYESE